MAKHKSASEQSEKLTLSPRTDKAVEAIFKIAPADVKRIVASRPGKRRKK